MKEFSRFFACIQIFFKGEWNNQRIVFKAPAQGMT